MSRGRKPKSLIDSATQTESNPIKTTNPIDQEITKSNENAFAEIDKIFGSIEKLSNALKVPIENLKFEKEGDEIFIYDYNEGRIKGNQKKLILYGKI